VLRFKIPLSSLPYAFLRARYFHRQQASQVQCVHSSGMLFFFLGFINGICCDRCLLATPIAIAGYLQASKFF